MKKTTKMEKTRVPVARAGAEKKTLQEVLEALYLLFVSVTCMEY